MFKDHETEVISPGSYGILEPNLDSNNIKALIAPHTGLNFPLAIYSADPNPNKQVGLFTVVDIPAQFSIITEEVKTLFQARGVNEVSIQIANFQGQVARDYATRPASSDGITSFVLSKVSEFTAGIVFDLYHSGFEIQKVTHLEDPSKKGKRSLGASALFTLPKGITMIRNLEFAYDKNTYRKAEDLRHRQIIEAAMLQSPAPDLICSYRPNLVLPPS